MEEFDESISSENLINHLQNIIENIQNGKYKDYERQDIFNVTEEFLQDERGYDVIDPTITEYLFRGWWLANAIRNTFEENNLDVCPCCMKKIENP